MLLPVERKSVEPMAAQLAPARVRAEHQRLHHFVANAAWDDAALLGAVREHVLECVPEVLILDDTGFPKKGKASVGVARQYCGQAGKQDNCQVTVSVSLANERYSLPVAYRLYLPEDWANDARRREKCGVPEGMEFATKPRIALALLDQVRTGAACPGTVVADAGYGVDTAFRERLGALGLSYVVGITGAVTLWPAGQTPGLPQRTSKRGRPPTRLRDEAYPPVSAKALALQLPPTSYRRVTWREGTNTALRSRFAAVRVRAAHRHRPRPAEWLLIEWPAGDAGPFKYFLSTLPTHTRLKELVRVAKLRWRIERDYQELKQELGLGHFEGRGWRGFHHHATLCIAAYGFLVTQRLTAKKTAALAFLRQKPALPKNFRPRGAPPAPRRRIDRHAAPDARRRAGRAT